MRDALPHDDQRTCPADDGAPRAGAAILQSVARLSTSRFNARAGLGADVAVSLALLGAGLIRHDLPLTTMLLIVACGVFVFSFVEYCVHRWLFHGPVGAFERGHRHHHEQPLGDDALPFFLPPLAMLGIAFALHFAMPTSAALLLAGAIAFGYACYGLGHVAIHLFRFRNPLLRRWAAAHHVHHYHPERNFGVTSPLWDYVLRTSYASTAKPHKR